MFREDQYFEAKVMLRSHKDALDCIQGYFLLNRIKGIYHFSNNTIDLMTSAERKMNLQNYENLVNIIIDAKKNRGLNFYFGNDDLQQLANATIKKKFKQANLQNLSIKQQIEFKYEEVQKGPKFQNLKEIKLFQFSNFIFKRYFNTFDDFKGDYEGLKKTLNEGLFNMKKDYDIANQKS